METCSFLIILMDISEFSIFFKFYYIFRENLGKKIATFEIIHFSGVEKNESVISVFANLNSQAIDEMWCEGVKLNVERRSTRKRRE